MRINGNYELDFAFASFADPMRLHVQPVRITVDFDRRARFGNHIENSFDVAFKWRPPLNQTSERVPPNLEHRLTHGCDNPLRHLLRVHFVARMNARYDYVELLQNPVRIIQRSILENV